MACGSGSRVNMVRAEMSPAFLQPTNHLDLDTIEALISALEAFEGAIVAVSHDVFFVEKLVSRDFVYTVGGKHAALKGIPGQ